MQKKAICLGFYDRGTGKHQSNTVFSFRGGVSDNHDSRYYGIPTDKGGKAVEKKIIRIGQASNDGSQAGVVVSRGGCSFTICACTHGYAIGYVLRKYEKNNSDMRFGRRRGTWPSADRGGYSNCGYGNRVQRPYESVEEVWRKGSRSWAA